LINLIENLKRSMERVKNMNKEKIDNGIRDLVKLLNEKGFKTDYSCSGLMEDHKIFKRQGTGYISFLPMSVEKEEELKKITLSCHLGFGGRDDVQDVNFDENGKMILTQSDNERCMIINSFEEKNVVKMSNFIITDEMVNDMFKTAWELFKKEIEK